MKKQMLKSALIALAGVGLMSGVALALPYGGDSTSLENIFNGATVGNTTINVNNGYLDDSLDSYWFITSGNQSSATFIVELAGWASTNKFGVYDKRTDGTLSRVILFDGAADDYDKVAFAINTNGKVTVTYQKYDSNGDLDPIASKTKQYDAGFTDNSFGFFINSKDAGTNEDGIWYSDSSLNKDKSDHMLAYQGTGDTLQIGPWVPGEMTNVEYFLAFEDKIASSADWDYDDMVLLIESVKPVPEPTTMLLFGTGLIGLANITRRKSARRLG